MDSTESDSKSKFLVVLSDDGFKRLNSHSFMKAVLKQGKNLRCVDVDYGPLLRVKASVDYAAEGTNEVRSLTLGLSLQYSDVSFVVSSDNNAKQVVPEPPPPRDLR
jgi:hypothetical protein